MIQNYIMGRNVSMAFLLLKGMHDNSYLHPLSLTSHPIHHTRITLGIHTSVARTAATKNQTALKQNFKPDL